MALLTTLGKGQGFLKAGFLGFQASGKTYTATSLAVGLRKHGKLKGPIAMFDTEGGSEYIAERVKKETGLDLLGVKSQSFQDLIDMSQECVQSGVSVLIVDSVTHVWREICDSYLEHVNQQRAKKNLPARTKLEFQDWNPIKKKWADWTTFYLNSKLHIIICGRAGFEYEMDRNEETGQKELVKTGIKMKTETEFGFEPSLLIEMERVQVPQRDGGFKMMHHAKVIKDRFGVLDGAEADNPTFDFFLPHIARLTPGELHPIDTKAKTPMHVDEIGRDEFDRRKHAQRKAWEEIENGLALIYPSSQGKDRQSRYGLLQELTGSTSETKIQELPPERLERVALVIRQLGSDLYNGVEIENHRAHARALYDSYSVEPDGAGSSAGGEMPSQSVDAPTQQASDAAPPFNPETCPPEKHLVVGNVCQQFRLSESIAELSGVMNQWLEEADQHSAADRAEVNKVFAEAKKRLGKR